MRLVSFQVPRTRKRNGLDLKSESLLIRFFICVMLSCVDIAMPGNFTVVLLASIVIFYSLFVPKLGEVNLTILVTVGPVYALCAILFLSFAFDIKPILINDVRAIYFTKENARIALLCNLQYLFMLQPLMRISRKDFAYRPNLSVDYRLMIIALLILSSIMANQSGTIVEGGYGEVEFKTSRWGGWPLIFIFSCAVYIYYSRMAQRFDFFFLGSVVVYWLLHGNRSEVLSLSLLFTAFYFFNFAGSQRSRITFSAALIWIASAAAVFAAFQFIGTARVAGLDGAHDTSVLFNILEGDRVRISTIGSAAYSAVAAVAVAENGNYLWGAGYLGHLANSVPSFIPLPWGRFEDIVAFLDGANVLGGVGVVGESYMNFGLFGPAIFGLLSALALAKLSSSCRQSSLAAIALISVALYSPRFVFYGYVYLHKTILLFAFLYLVSAIFRKPKKLV